MKSEFSGLSLVSPSASSTLTQSGAIDTSTLASSLSFDESIKLLRRSSFVASTSLAPIFLVDGFLILEAMDVWVDVIAHFKQRAALSQTPCPPLHRLQSGGISSAHDMAVSIFYQIKGGREDFGEAHAKKHQHERYGHTHPGIYPEWTGESPIHLLSYSFGGNVVMELQKLLDEQFFCNEKGEKYLTDGGWILSTAFISVPLRGSTAAYYIGSNVGERGAVRYFSLGRLLYILVQIWEWLACHDSPKGWLGVHFRMNHFKLSKNRSVFNLIKTIFGVEYFDKGLDNSSKDIVVEKYLKEPYLTHNTTFYRTYASTMTNITQFGNETPINHWIPGLTYLSKWMGRFNIKVQGKGLMDSMLPYENLWRKNDGIIPLISQLHPQDCCEQSCSHINLPIPFKPYTACLPSKLNPGTWYCSIISDCSHFDLVPGFNLSFDIPPVNQYISGWWSRLICIIFPTNYKCSTSPNHPAYDASLSEYRSIVIDDYIQFKAKAEFLRSSAVGFAKSTNLC